MHPDRKKLSDVENGRWFANGTDRILLLKETTRQLLLDELEDCENQYRDAIAETLLSTPASVHSHPLSRVRTPADVPKFEAEHGKSAPLFLSGTMDDSGNSESYKFLYVKQKQVFREWLISNGNWPSRKRPDGSKYYPMRGHGISIHSMIFCLNKHELSSLMNSVLVDSKTRASLGSSIWENSISADFAPVRKFIHSNSHLSVSALLQKLFTDHLQSETSRRGKPLPGFGATRRGALTFLIHLASRQILLLPIEKVAAHSKSIAFLFTSVWRPRLLAKFLPQHIYEELIHCTLADVSRFPAKSKKVSRRLKQSDLIALYFGTNYCSEPGFKPQTLELARTFLASSVHGLRAYCRDCMEFYKVPNSIRAEVEKTWSARQSASVLKHRPFALFTEHPVKAKALFKVQLNTFEHRTQLKFPGNGFNVNIHEWASLLEDTISTIHGRKSLADYDAAGVAWLTYLHTLSDEERPTGFQDVKRKHHINDPSDITKATYAAFLARNGMDPLYFMRPVHQLYLRWSNEHEKESSSPFRPGVDWKNRNTTFGTHRRAIPPDIAKVLITENAKPSNDGKPYALYINWKASNKSTTTRHINGKSIDELVPVVPAVLDCILTFGLRSDSARWLDSGQADRYYVDIQTKTKRLNKSRDRAHDLQNGFLQLLEIEPGREVLSLKVLKDKTMKVLEIPFFPENLAKRLLFLKKVQEKYSPLDRPVLAMNSNTRTNDADLYPLIFPLMRDPKYFDGRAVSRGKVVTWWKYLLRHCEVLYNAQQKDLLGDDHVYFSFFDQVGAPLWDIHSIRVSIVTNLLEQGVSPSIVQMLVGHRSPTITMHYKAVEHAKVHQVLSDMHQRVLASINKEILSAETEDELEQALNRALGGIVALEENEGIAKAQENLRGATNLANGKEAVTVFSHGICPGGVCGQGGRTKGTVRTGVHRSKACSRCRFRITGPAFIRGLIMNANLIMREIGESTRAEIRINSEIRNARRNNEPTAHIESRKHQELEFRGELFADWAAEYQTIKSAIQMLYDNENSKNLPSNLPELSAVIRHEHHFNLLQDVLDSSDLIPGGNLDIPTGVRDSRDKILLEILRMNGDTRHFLLNANEVVEKKSLDQFGKLLSKIDRANTEEDVISALQDGSQQLPDSILAMLGLEGGEDD